MHKHCGGNGFGANTAPEPVIRRDCFYRNQAHYPVPFRSRVECLETGVQKSKVALNLLVVDFGQIISPF